MVRKLFILSNLLFFSLIGQTSATNLNCKVAEKIF